MFAWAAIFLIIALVSGVFGFGGLAGTAVGIAQTLFWIGLLLFIVTLLYSFATGRKGPQL